MRTIVMFVTISGLLSSVSFAKENPYKRTENLIATFKQVKTSAEGKSLRPADIKNNSNTFQKLDGFFDWEQLLSKPFEPHRKKFSGEQLMRTQAIFKKLIRIIAYQNSGDFFRKAQYSLKQPVIKQNQADVVMTGELVEEDFEVSVTFHWMNSKAGWRIFDVSFDDASLVKDYQNQFGRIIKKEGAQGLLKRMEERLQEEYAKRGKMP